MVNEKKKLSNVCILDNDDTKCFDSIDQQKNLETSQDNDSFELVKNVKNNKKSGIKLSTNLNFQVNNSANSVNQNIKYETKNIVKSEISNSNVTKHEKRLYVHNFLNYNFHKINRYLPVEEYELDYETSESEFDDDIYDY